MRRNFRLTSAWAIVLVAALLTLSAVLFAAVSNRRQDADSLSKVLGDWEGESVCVDKNRPACKNEHVVYHIKKKDDEADAVSIQADRIVDGRPVDMGTLDCNYDAGKSTITCEFNINTTHGIFEFKIKDDEMEGTLKILPAGTLGRKINVKKVQNVPPAP